MGSFMLIWTLDHHQFGAIIRGVTRLLDERPEPKHRLDLTIAL